MSTYEAPKYNSEMIKSCPNDTEKYAYGCYCKNSGKFFDKKVSYSCVNSIFFCYFSLSINDLRSSRIVCELSQQLFDVWD